MRVPTGNVMEIPTEYYDPEPANQEMKWWYWFLLPCAVFRIVVGK